MTHAWYVTRDCDQCTRDQAVMASASAPEDDRQPKRRGKRSVLDFPYKSWFAQATTFVVDERNPGKTHDAWVAHVKYQAWLVRRSHVTTQNEHDTRERFRHAVRPDKPEVGEKSEFADRAHELLRIQLPKELEEYWMLRLALDWDRHRHARQLANLARERRMMALADSDGPVYGTANAFSKTDEAKNIALFLPWPSGRMAILPYRLLNEPFPSDIARDELIGYFGAGDDAPPVNRDDTVREFSEQDNADLWSYIEEYDAITNGRESALRTRTEESAGRTSYRRTWGTEWALFFYDLAKGPRSYAGKSAGLPPVQDIIDQTRFIRSNGVADTIRSYTQHSFEILQVTRSQFDERKGKPGLHKRVRIDQSNALLDAVYRAPHSHTPLLLARFQSTFAGWDGLREYCDAVATGGADKAEAAARLFGHWRTSTSFLSTSYNPEFTFEHQALLYIIYHLHPDCAWLWMENDREAEILLPPGVQMRAVRAAATHEIPTEHRPIHSVYVLEVLVRPGVKVEPYDLAPAPESPSYGPASPSYGPLSPSYVPDNPPPPGSQASGSDGSHGDAMLYAPTSPSYGPP